MKPIITLQDVWSNLEASQKDKPTLLKIEDGFLDAEKPIHSDINWILNQISGYVAAMDTLGVPAWDSGTSYPVNAITWHNNESYYSLYANSNSEPPSSNWVAFSELSYEESEIFFMVNTPYITYVSGSGTVHSSDFTTDEEFYHGPHSASDWIISNDSEFTDIFETSTNDTVNLASYEIDSPIFGNTYYIKTRHRSDNHFGEWSNSYTFKYEDAIVLPTITVTGQNSNVPELPVISGGDYQILGAPGAHTDTDWVITEDEIEIWRVNSTTDLTSILVPDSLLTEDTEYVVEVRYNSATMTSSYATKTVSTKEYFFPTVEAQTIEREVGSFGIAADDYKTIVIGSPGSHKAYIYSNTGSAWSQIQEISYPGNDNIFDGTRAFGDSVNISDDGNFIYIANTDEEEVQNSATIKKAGRVWVYKRNGLTYDYVESLTIPYPAGTSYLSGPQEFGAGIVSSANGSRLYISSKWKACSTYDGSYLYGATVLVGSTYVYDWDGSNYIYDTYLKPASSDDGSYFYTAGDVGLYNIDCSSNGDTLIMGARCQRETNVSVFYDNGSSWDEQFTLNTNDEPDDIGDVVSITNDGNMLLASYGRWDFLGSRVYTRSGATWTHYQTFGSNLGIVSGDGNYAFDPSSLYENSGGSFSSLGIDVGSSRSIAKYSSDETVLAVTNYDGNELIIYI